MVLRRFSKIPKSVAIPYIFWKELRLLKQPAPRVELMKLTKLQAIVAMVLICPLFVCGCNWSATRHNTLGRESFLNGQFSQAINQFQQALNREPNNPDALYNMGVTYFTLGKQSRNTQWIGQGEQLLRQSIAQNDQHVDAHRSLAVLLVESGRRSDALDLLNTWQQRHPESSEPLVELARLYQEFGDQTQATNLLANALQVDGTNIRALKAMGHVRELQGQYNLALDNYLRSYQLDSRQVDVATKISEMQTRIAQATTNNPATGLLNR